MLIKDQSYGPAAGSIAVVGARLVLGQSPFKADDRRADIVAAVSAKQDVEVSAHRSCVLRDASRLRRNAPQDDGVWGMASKKIRHPEALRAAKPGRTQRRDPASWNVSSPSPASAGCAGRAGSARRGRARGGPNW